MPRPQPAQLPDGLLKELRPEFPTLVFVAVTDWTFDVYTERGGYLGLVSKTTESLTAPHRYSGSRGDAVFPERSDAGTAIADLLLAVVQATPNPERLGVVLDDERRDSMSDRRVVRYDALTAQPPQIVRDTVTNEICVAMWIETPTENVIISFPRALADQVAAWWAHGPDATP